MPQDIYTQPMVHLQLLMIMENIGIGTTNPGYELEVVGDARLLAGNDYYIGDIGLK